MVSWRVQIDDGAPGFSSAPCQYSLRLSKLDKHPLSEALAGNSKEFAAARWA